MTTKKPATPLPWITEYDERGTCFLRGADLRPGNAVMNTRRTAGKLNAAYIAHAANSYPALVEALHKLIPYAAQTCNGKPMHQAIHGHQMEVVQGATALLRSLGEE